MAHQHGRQPRGRRSRLGTGSVLLALLFAAAAITGGQTPSEYTIPLPVPPPSGNSSRPQCITPGPNGNLWVAERNDSQIGRISPSGQITFASACDTSAF